MFVKMLTILSANYLSDYKIQIYFNNGKQGIVDLSDLILRPQLNVFYRLNNLDDFKSFNVDYTICWGSELDLSPEYLFFKSFESDPMLKDQFRKWGYAS